ncbi:MAG TPA: sulfotransferase [Oscillatoriales cyanobacterium M4454_W2019_049]|nr:sulfotransferase [Oscillatoriales cyanobacterium M4454_W2019_049]
MLKSLPILRQKPILIVGLPRSGTTWLASILNTARGIEYFHEPFNSNHVPEAVLLADKYLRENDIDREFEAYCQKIFSGKHESGFVCHKLSDFYQKYRWFPGRVMVKDVRCHHTLAWIDRHISPTIIIAMRHPCAVANSLLRLYGEGVGDRLFQRILNLPELIEDYLHPFQDLFDRAEGFWQKIGVVWGATYYVIQQQSLQKNNWIFVKHESLCLDPERKYRQLFDRLNLQWTTQTDRLLNLSTTQDSGHPYVPERIASQEYNKWKKQIEPCQIEQVKEFVLPFKLPYYSDF